MAKGKFVKCLSIAVLFLFSVAFLVYAAEPPEKITLKDSLWPSPTKTPVEFNHKKHSEEYKVACDQCHHIYQDGKNTWKQGDAVQPCDKCHTEATFQGEKKLPPDQQKLNLKLAFHNNCVGCHQKLKKENAESKAPVTCAQCHPGAKAE
jgi:hypothetical protein